MTPAEFESYAMIGSGVVTTLAVLAGGIYMRGKLDAHAQAAARSLTDVKLEVEKLTEARFETERERGAQEERNRAVDALAESSQATRDLANSLSAKLQAHLDTCEKGQRAFDKRLDRFEQSIAGLQRSLANMVLKVAPADAVELPPTRRRVRG